ncbi:MAG: hypothetical protein Q27BPR15_12985 [Rhodobacter sp. CACIA14H1]|nr:MAG: hypothetical protein Q27BPR15_12985 [Rhodobacter sp. CACIA14H1]
MKKVLLATTVLVGTAGFAAAEGLTVTGSGVFGLNYAENAAVGADRTTPIMETYIAFAGAGETDSGLSFGMSSTLGQYATLAGAYEDDGTTLFISGAFGKITFGDVSEADEVAGLGDIGLTGIGVDNVAEATTGDSSGGVAHDVNYSYSAGDFSVAVSGRIGASDLINANDSFAIGAKYTFGDYYVGLGYNDTDVLAIIDGVRDGATTSIYAGGSAGDVSVKAMYASFSPDAAAAATVKSYGMNVDYTVGAATVSFAFADNDAVGNTKASYGVGVSYDLGGGASVVGGVGSVNDVTRAQAGVSLKF